MFSIVMAGGSGTRFWPASRAHLPKQFLRITSQHTLFEETLQRIRPLVGDENIYVVVNRLHEATTRELLGEGNAQVLVEPVGRNTAPCIGLAALFIRRLQVDEPIIVLPADHFIADVEGFRRKLVAACEVARAGAIVTLGIPPTRPETGFGYIECGAACAPVKGEESVIVKRFVEKPNAETALAYLAGGKHLWNSGIFIFTAKTILAELQTCVPELYEGLQEIDRAIGTAQFAAVMEKLYPTFESISIDYAVMERTHAPIRSLRGDFGWSDVGSWQALYELRSDQYDVDGNLLLGDALTIEARRNLVYSTTQRKVALLGVEELVIVDTPDVLLVGKRERSQDVKLFPEQLKKRGEPEFS